MTESSNPRMPTSASHSKVPNMTAPLTLISYPLAHLILIRLETLTYCQPDNIYCIGMYGIHYGNMDLSCKYGERKHSIGTLGSIIYVLMWNILSCGDHKVSVGPESRFSL